MGNYFILNHGTEDNKEPQHALINEVHRALGTSNSSVICNDGPGSHTLPHRHDHLNRTAQGHPHIQKTAKDVVQQM
jgi:hypothetical protein